jgi:hypothetical protein
MKSLLPKIAHLLGLSSEEMATAKKFPANPDRKPHRITSHPQPCGVHLTLCSFWSLNTSGQRQGKAHGPDNRMEHPVFREHYVPRSKYKPKVGNVPGRLRRSNAHA